MAYLDFLTKNFKHFERSKRKKESINAVLNSNNLQNQGVINLHRIDKNNAGDFYCGPHLYFDALKGKGVDLFDYKKEDASIRQNWINQIELNSLVVGGGGLLNRPGFSKHMEMFEALSKTNKKIVLWGLGHNSKNKSDFGKPINYNITSSNYDLVGVRDYGRKEEWVPCVSCMHPIFDEVKTNKREIGVVFHQKTLRNPRVTKKFSNYDSIANNTDFESMVSFISESETVLTDSYHAMYWAMILEKKVMVFPNSSKFYNFKYQPIISSFDNYAADMNKLQIYTGVKEECREINKTFSEKVFDLLNL